MPASRRRPLRQPPSCPGASGIRAARVLPRVADDGSKRHGSRGGARAGSAPESVPQSGRPGRRAPPRAPGRRRRRPPVRVADERLVRQALACGRQPALGLGELALEAVAFEHRRRQVVRHPDADDRPRSRRRRRSRPGHRGPAVAVRGPRASGARRSGRARASRSMAGRSASNVGPRSGRHVDGRLEPVGGGELRRGAGVADLGHEVDQRTDLRARRRRRAPPPRASGRR